MHDSQMQRGGILTLGVTAVDIDVRTVHQHFDNISIATVGSCMQGSVASV